MMARRNPENFSRLYWARVTLIDVPVVALLLAYQPAARLVYFSFASEMAFRIATYTVTIFVILAALLILLGRAKSHFGAAAIGHLLVILIFLTVVYAHKTDHGTAVLCVSAFLIALTDWKAGREPSDPVSIEPARHLIDGTLAIMYVSAAISKLPHLQIWFTGGSLRDYCFRMLVSDMTLWTGATRACAASTTLGLVVQPLALFVEAAAVFLFSSSFRIRSTLRIGLFAFHLGVAAFMGLPFIFNFALLGWAELADRAVVKTQKTLGLNAL